MNKLHVVVVTETYPPEINGVARTLQRTVRFLANRGHHVELIRPRQPSDRETADKDAAGRMDVDAAIDARVGIQLTHGIPIPMYRDLRMGLARSAQLANRWRSRRPDIVHVATEGPLGVAARNAARRIGIACSSDFRTNFHLYSQHYHMGMLVPAVLRYLRWFHNGTDLTLVPTSALRDQLRNQRFRNLRVVGRGVDGREFSPDYRSEPVRRGWGASRDQLVVLHVGRLASEKNIEVVVRASDALSRRGLAHRLVLVGDGPLRGALQRRLPHATFTGWQRGAALAATYASADLFLFPSMTETFGNVVLEALASGLPMVAYDHAAAGEHIVSERNGLSVPFGDETAFIDAAIRLVGDARLRRTMGQSARHAATQLSWEVVLGQFEAALIEASASRGVRHVANLARAA